MSPKFAKFGGQTKCTMGSSKIENGRGEDRESSFNMTRGDEDIERGL